MDPIAKEANIVLFLEKYEIGKSHRKVRDLLEMGDVPRQAYQANIIISHCCKVNQKQLLRIILILKALVLILFIVGRRFESCNDNL